MSGKDSRQKSSTMMKSLSKYATPPLVTSYINAVRQICGIDRVFVYKNLYDKFLNVQFILDNKGIEYDEYALSVVNAWWSWCKKKHMKSVPAIMFCGKKAMERFYKERETFIADTKADDVTYEELYNEVLYAEVCIHSRMFPLSMIDVNVASRCCRLTDVSRRPMIDALEIICDAYGIQAGSYNEVADILSKRLQLT